MTESTEHAGSAARVPDFSWLPDAVRERRQMSAEELVERQRIETEEQLTGARERLTASYRRVRQLEEAVRHWDWFAERLPGRAELRG